MSRRTIFSSVSQVFFSKFISKNIKIKWPNDLLYNKEKICGILQEVISFERKNFLIIGVGLNTNFAPYNRGFSSTSLKDIANKRIDNKKIINDIKNKYEKLLNEITRFSFLKLLKKYISESDKILPSRITSVSQGKQRKLNFLP